jgi:hypothetical protein
MKILFFVLGVSFISSTVFAGPQCSDLSGTYQRPNMVNRMVLTQTGCDSMEMKYEGGTPEILKADGVIRRSHEDAEKIIYIYALMNSDSFHYLSGLERKDTGKKFFGNLILSLESNGNILAKRTVSNELGVILKVSEVWVKQAGRKP